MYALVALLCLYKGGQNIKKAFVLAPFSQWEFINWSLFITGVLMLAAVIPCIRTATREMKDRQEQMEIKKQEEKQKRQQQFFYDDEDNDEPAADENDLSL